jgi:hypothetical protein
MRRTARLLTLVFALFAADNQAVHAQSRESHWGVSGSLVPHWVFPDPLANAWDLETNIVGSEFRIGIVHGSDRGGDVGVSFVKKHVADESFVNLRETACVQVPGSGPECARGTYHITHDAGFTGVEAHVFLPFGTIAQRVQIGGTFAGGVARIDGTVDRFVEHLVINGTNVTRVTDALGPGTFKETMQDIPQEWSVTPIGRAELSVAVLVRPGLKIRASGGINFPGFHVIGFYAHYLFGAR